MNNTKIVVNSKKQAWEEVNKIFPTDYEKDYSASERAGYDIYRHRESNYYCRICDLGDRLEVLTGEHGENVTNIWIEKKEEHRAMDKKDLMQIFIDHTSMLIKNAEKHSPEPQLEIAIRENMRLIVETFY